MRAGQEKIGKVESASHIRLKREPGQYPSIQLTHSFHAQSTFHHPLPFMARSSVVEMNSKESQLI
jgi:hypothetical protein